MKDEVKSMIEDIPLAIKPTITMDEPNQSILIHEGNFKLVQGTMEINLTGTVKLLWFPTLKVKFNGIVEFCSEKEINLISSDGNFDLSINEEKLGSFYLVNKTFSDQVELSGILKGRAILGDGTIKVDRLRFVIPNLRDFFGEPIRDETENYLGRDRLVFENEYFTIRIDRERNFKDKVSRLKDTGGYVFLYNGEMICHKNPVSTEDISDTIHSFSTFLSFLNGRRTTPLIIQGMDDGKTIWTDYTDYTVDQYQYVTTWPAKHDINGLNELWQEFYKLWRNKSDKNLLISAVHWYVEANAYSGYVEGSITWTQTALELMYNWFVVEKNQLIRGRDCENLSAANKVRLLLSQVNGMNNDNINLENLKQFVRDNNSIHDEIDAFVEIRNAIVHSQKEKRLKLENISTIVKYEALEFGIWCLEISLLNILKFKGVFYNRCSRKLWAGEGEERSPLASKKQNH